jgi:hypothetical protein
MTWADFVLNLSKLINNCFSTEEARLIWLRDCGWEVGVNDGVVWCRSGLCPEDIMTPSGAVTFQSGLILNTLMEVNNLPIREDLEGFQKGMVI